MKQTPHASCVTATAHTHTSYQRQANTITEGKHSEPAFLIYTASVKVILHVYHKVTNTVTISQLEIYNVILAENSNDGSIALASPCFRETMLFIPVHVTHSISLG